MNKFMSRHLSAFLFFLIIGTIVGRHFIVNKGAQKAINVEQLNQVNQELEALENERQNLEDDYQELRAQLDDLWSENLAENQTASDSLMDELFFAREFAGLSDVQGAGIIVSVNDKENYQPLQDHIASLIHDENIRYLVDLLVNNGAQAISINDLRIVNSSEIFCVGTTILCNNQRMTPPYIIKAIGPQNELIMAVEKDSVYSALTAEPYFIRLNTEKVDQLIIRGYETPARIDEDINLLMESKQD